MTSRATPSVKTLNIIGAGRVGKTLARLWQQGGICHVHDILTRSQPSAQEAVAFIGAGRAVASLADMRDADLWMLAVPDSAIAATAQQLAGLARQRGMGATAFHCSGALAADELAPLAALHWPVASAHCILSFASPAAALAQFAGTPCGLEGDGAALATLQPAFQAVGAECFTLTADNKLLYHAAAVFATNFLPVLQAMAQQLWRDTGMPEHVLPRLQTTLLNNAVQNIQALGAVGALTGPARSEEHTSELQSQR